MNERLDSAPAGRKTARLSAAVLGFALFGATAAFSGAGPAGADHGSHFDLVSQTRFVGERAPVIRVRVTGAAGTDRLTVRILAPRTTRAEVRAGAADLGDEPSLSFFEVPRDEPLDEEQIVRIRIPDEEVGELLRQEPGGALPVVIELRSEADEIRDTFVTHLLVLGDGAELDLGFVADLSVPTARQADQSIELDVVQLVDRTAAIDDYAVPVGVILRPETLDALAGPATTGEADAVRDALEGREVLRAPWVELDEEGWRLAGESDLVTDHYARGAATVEQQLGDSPSAVVLLDPDATAATLGLLRTAGATAALTVETHVARGIGDRAPRPVHVLDDNGLAMPVLTFDDDLHATLLNPDPELAGHRALAELAVMAATADAPLAVLTRIDGVDPVALDVLTAGFDQQDWLRTRPITRLFEVDPTLDPTGLIVRGTLQSTPPPSLDLRAGDIGLTAGMIDAYAAMVAPAEGPVAPLRTQLLAAAASDLDDEAARAYTAAVFEEVLAGTAGVSIVPSERITLTDRRADLPLTLRNEQPLPIRVELILSAAKIRFPDGEQLSLVLQPGDNERTIRVETLASGDARITATLTSPDGRLELGAGTIDIRSTAISGLGLLISIAALAVLAAWWARTILRVRRTRAAATVAPAPDPGPHRPEGEP